jgi:hypothetical protein
MERGSFDRIWLGIQIAVAVLAASGFAMQISLAPSQWPAHWQFVAAFTAAAFAVERSIRLYLREHPKPDETDAVAETPEETRWILRGAALVLALPLAFIASRVPPCTNSIAPGVFEGFIPVAVLTQMQSMPHPLSQHLAIDSGCQLAEYFWIAVLFAALMARANSAARPLPRMVVAAASWAAVIIYLFPPVADMDDPARKIAFVPVLHWTTYNAMPAYGIMTAEYAALIAVTAVVLYVLNAIERGAALSTK